MTTLDLNSFFDKVRPAASWWIEERVGTVWVRISPPLGDAAPLTESDAKAVLVFLRGLKGRREFRLASNARAPVGALSIVEPSPAGRLSIATEGGDLSLVDGPAPRGGRQ